MTKNVIGGERMVAKGSEGRMNRDAIKDRIIELLKDNDFTDVFESGDVVVDGSAGAALKAIVSEKAAEYATKAMQLAKKKRMKFGAAAVIIATRREK